MRIEEHYLLRAIQRAQPGARLPTRKQLADDSRGGLLGVYYQHVKENVQKMLSVKSQYISITNDVWFSILNESIINYIAVSPTRVHYFSKLHIPKSSHTIQTGPLRI